MEDFFSPLKYAISSFGNAFIIKFPDPGGVIFFNFDNTELKRPSKINFSVSERQRWAIGG